VAVVVTFTDIGDRRDHVFRNILKLVLLSFVVWLIAVSVLVGIFVFVPNQSSWLLPSAFKWLGVAWVAWLILVVRRVMKWRSAG
jgi:uncharacterized membrane protein